MWNPGGKAWLTPGYDVLALTAARADKNACAKGIASTMVLNASDTLSPSLMVKIGDHYQQSAYLAGELLPEHLRYS